MDIITAIAVTIVALVSALVSGRTYFFQSKSKQNLEKDDQEIKAHLDKMQIEIDRLRNVATRTTDKEQQLSTLQKSAEVVNQPVQQMLFELSRTMQAQMSIMQDQTMNGQHTTAILQDTVKRADRLMQGFFQVMQDQTMNGQHTTAILQDTVKRAESLMQGFFQAMQAQTINGQKTTVILENTTARITKAMQEISYSLRSLEDTIHQSTQVLTENQRKARMGNNEGAEDAAPVKDDYIDKDEDSHVIDAINSAESVFSLNGVPGLSPQINDPLQQILLELTKTMQMQTINREQTVTILDQATWRVVNTVENISTVLQSLEQSIHQFSLGRPNTQHLEQSDSADLSHIPNQPNIKPDLLIKTSNNFHVYNETYTPELSKILIYQQVAKEYNHAIYTPLSSIESAVANVTTHFHDPQKTDLLLDSLRNATLSIETIKSTLERGAGFFPGKAERFSILTLINKAIRMICISDPSRIEPVIHLDNVPDIEYYPVNLLLSMLPILENAYEAVRPEDIIHIEGSYDHENKFIRLLIANNGNSIPSEVQLQIFEKGFSTKGADRGAGLAMARHAMEKVNGQVQLVSSNDTQTVFAILFQPIATYENK